jgi:ubiquinone/menaquinone biosynthesis C-methylase UbiE
MATAVVEETKSTPEFLPRIIGILNDGMLCLAISMGHRTGLLDAMAGGAKATSAEIAKRAGLNERYVREWLGAMVTGQIVEYEPATKSYTLPAERAAFITRAAGIDNLATFTQFIALLGSVEDQVVRSFKRGGGVPYSEYADFQRLMAEDSAQTFDARLLQTTIPLIKGLAERLGSGIDVADIGCGSGHAINLLAKAFPASRFVGYDFSEEGLAAGRTEAKKEKLTNVRFESKDVSRLDMPSAFDFITSFDAIHDQAHPDRVLAAIRRALRPDGVYLCVDIGASSDLSKNLEHPLGPFLYTVSTMHCMTVSLALDGKGLGTVWGQELTLSMLADAGFGRVDVKRVEGDILNNYYIAYPK